MTAVYGKLVPSLSTDVVLVDGNPESDGWTDFSFQTQSQMTTKVVSKLTQYVIVRGDLLKSLEWPIGAVITQACHASSAALWLFREDSNTVAYTNELDCMHKVVLEAKNEQELLEISQKLVADKVDHKLWIEQPENYATCLATKPYLKEQLPKYLKKLKLYR